MRQEIEKTIEKILNTAILADTDVCDYCRSNSSESRIGRSLQSSQQQNESSSENKILFTLFVDIESRRSSHHIRYNCTYEHRVHHASSLIWSECANFQEEEERERESENVAKNCKDLRTFALDNGLWIRFVSAFDGWNWNECRKNNARNSARTQRFNRQRNYPEWRKENRAMFLNRARARNHF